MLLTVGACSSVPASLGGLKDVFHDPGFAVRGKTRKDQVWISQTQETGIRVLGWKRPPALPVKAKAIPKVSKLNIPAPVSIPGFTCTRLQYEAGECEPLTVEPPKPLAPAPKPSMTEKLRSRIQSMQDELKRLEHRQ